MSNKFAGSAHTERRVRPIYDALDYGKNKKAVQEADKVLKKQPNLLCAKALKCLALLRLGRESESLELLETVKNEAPTDDSTLQAVTVCYREVHQLESICELFKKANLKEPGNEDILNNLFLSYVRVGDYAQQKLTALNLYKINAKNQYYFWVFISTLLQSVDDVNDLVELCTIPANRNRKSTFVLADKAKNGIVLVHRMIEKFVAEGKIRTEQEVLTYILVLEMLGKHQEALNVLNGPLSNLVEELTAMNKKLDLLVKLGQWDQLHEQVEKMLLNEPDCWHCYLLYIDSIFELGKDDGCDPQNAESPFVKGKKMFDCLIKNQKDVKFKKRGPYLGRLEFYWALTRKEMPAKELLGDVLPLLEEYYTEFGTKDCCVHDLRKYVPLSGNECLKFLSFVHKSVGLNVEAPTTKTQLNLLMSSRELERVIGVKYLFDVNVRHKFMLSDLNKYIDCLPLCSDSVVTDLKPCDRFIVIIVHTLFELYTDTENSNYLYEAIVLCEYTLSHSRHHSQLKILLLKFYHLLGDTEGAQLAYYSLDLKHMQLDTLGYLHLFPLITNAAYNHAATVLNASVKFFTINSKESADHITIAYRCEALTKIPEFISIKEKMSNSIHFLLCTAERMLCEMFMAQNYSNAVQLAKDMEITLNLDRIKWNDLRDNRDFALSWDLEAPDRRLTEECIVQSHNHDLLTLRLRSLLLHCIVSCLNVGKVEKSPNGTEENDLTYLKARGNMMEYVCQLEETLKPVKSNIPSPLSKWFIAGPPVSRVLLMLQVNYFDLILNELRFLYHLIPCEDSNQEKCQYHLDAVVLFLDEYMRYLKTITNSSHIQLRNTVIQVSALLAELICFSCIVAGVCEVIMAKSKQNVAKKNRKKKENVPITDTQDEFEWRSALIGKFVSVFIGVIKNLESLLKSEEKLWADTKNQVCELVIAGNVNNKEELAKIETISRQVSLTLFESYNENITQLSSCLTVKSIYLNSIKL